MFTNGMIKNGNQNFLVCTNLKERLKQAGIKESKSECEEKHKKNNKSKKRKRYFTTSYSKKHIRRKMQSLLNNWQDNLEDLDKTLLDNGKLSSTNPHNNAELSKESLVVADECVAPEVGRESNTIIASLDFIQDCHNYKKKTRKGTEADKFKSSGKIPKTTSNNHTPRLDSQISNDDTNYGNLKKARVLLSVDETVRTKDTNCEIDDFHRKENNTNYKPVREKELTPLHHQILDDVAKIDKSYLQSIKLIVAGKEEKNSVGKTTENETETEENKKMTGKAFFEKKKQERDFQEQHQRSSQENRSSLRFQTVGTQRPQQGEKISKFCNLTKSEQIQHLPDVSGTRKKRKLKNKHLDNNANEFIETSLPSEVSKTAVIKELWRRNGEKRSENSLSSRSTNTLPEGDDVPGNKNLESYKLLLKFVHQEIQQITSKAEKEDTKEKDDNTETLKYPGKLRKIYDKLFENSQEISSLKKKLVQTTPEEWDSPLPEKQKISETLLKYSEGVPEYEISNWKLLEKEDKKSSKLPVQVTQNLAILNRLEQAFLALGTPNFPNQNATSVTSKNSRGTQNQQNQQLAIENSKKVHRNSKDQLKKDFLKPKSLKVRLQQEIPSRRASQASYLKKIEKERINLLKKNQEWSDNKKDSTAQKLQINYDKVTKEEENKAKQIKKKLQAKPRIPSPKPTGTENSSQNVKQARRSKSYCKNDINTIKFPRAVIEAKNVNEKNSTDEVEIKEKNLAVLNRLEQSFLALRTPNFPKENVNSLTSKNSRGTLNQQNQQVAAENKKKTHRISKDQLKKENKDFLKPKSLKVRLQQEIPSRRASEASYLKKNEKERINILKKNQEWNDNKKDSKAQKLQKNYDKVTKEKENKANQIKKKLQAKPQIPSPKPTGTENSSQNVKREKTPTSAPKAKIGKPPELIIVKLGVESVSDLTGGNLSRKSTFTVISEDSCINEAGRSKSCCKIDMNAIQFPRTVIEAKNLNEKNSTDEVESKEKSKKTRSKSNEGVRGNKVALSITPKKPIKSLVKESSFYNMKNFENYDNEKRCKKKNSENTISLLSNQRREKKKNKETIPLNEIVLKKEVSRNYLSCHVGRYFKMYGTASINTKCMDATAEICNIKDRILKKPSTLTVHINQSWIQTEQTLEQPERDENIVVSTLYSDADNFLTSNSTNGINTLQVVVDNVGSSDSIKTYTKEIPKRPSQVYPCSSASIATDPSNPMATVYCHPSNITIVIDPGKTLKREPQWEQDDPSNPMATAYSHPSNITIVVDPGKTLKREPLWEQDSSRYRDIVKDIMSQYNRIDGLLKQSEKLNQISIDAAHENNTPDKYNSHINLEEYRKRIISEYQAVPIFEYKSKQKQEQKETPEGMYFSDDSKRSLSVAKSFAYVDEDVKDHYPKVKKVLSSTLYVEPKNIRSPEKKASLQDSFFFQNDRIFNSEQMLKSFSTTTIGQRFNDRMPECEFSPTEYRRSVSMTDCSEDTNSLGPQISGTPTITIGT